MIGIDQQLDGNIIDGLYAANAPSTSNPVATMADVGQGIPPFADERQFVFVENFTNGSLPPGWTGSISGTGASITYTQVSESGVSPGLALATIGTAALSRVSILTGSGFQYMRTFTDGPETTCFIQMRWSPS